jgi:hypothetical protein
MVLPSDDRGGLALIVKHESVTGFDLFCDTPLGSAVSLSQNNIVGTPHCRLLISYFETDARMLSISESSIAPEKV